MLFKVKDLDEPLHVSEPVMCRVCKQGCNYGISKRCVHCLTMHEAVKDLIKMKLQLSTLNLGGRYAASHRTNKLSATCDSLSRKSG
jgi:hypothetical protein